MFLEEPFGNIFVCFVKEFLGQNRSSCLVVGLWDFGKLFTLLDDRVKDLHEVLKRVLVKVVDL